MSGKLSTTIEVAKAAGVPRTTLQHWIKTRKISAPRIRLVAGKAVRLWSKHQLRQVRRLARKRIVSQRQPPPLAIADSAEGGKK